MVISCASASSEGLGPNPHLESSQSVTKEWKSLSTCRLALWTWSRWNLLREGRLIAAKEQAKVRRQKKRKKKKKKEKEGGGRTYPHDKGFLSPHITTKCIPTNVHRIPSPEARDEEKLRLPFSIRRGQGPN